MNKILLIFFLLIFSQTAIAQEAKFSGNWIGCGLWGMNYIKIKKLTNLFQPKRFIIFVIIN